MGKVLSGELKQVLFYNTVMHPKDADAMENIVDPYQMEQSDLGLHCLLSPICLYT